jgi:membrane-associated phospholipid phosphatase
VESRQHYRRDVVAGAGIGILSSYIFTRPYKGWRVSLGGSTKSVCVQLTRQF